MCNIAGYVGDKQAAPILIDMLRREAIYDGGFSTGIATIHNGEIHWRKVIGTIDDLLSKTDALSLPGTIGIAHSRPYNDHLFNAHPFVSLDNQLALVENGTFPRDDFIPKRDAVANMLFKKGYNFISKQSADKKTFPVLKSGEAVHSCEVTVNLAAYYLKEGCSWDDALTLATNDTYCENVNVMINKDYEDHISVCRVTRPMEVMLAKGESYIASTRFAFPDDVCGDMYTLPTLHTCRIEKGSYTVTSCKVEADNVCEITPLTYIKAYKHAEEMLSGGKDHPCTYDDIELAFRDMPELWYEQYTYSQYAKLAYDVLWQFHMEGRLRIIVAPQTLGCGTRDIAYMWLE